MERVIEMSSEGPIKNRPSKKEIAISFLQLVVEGKVREAFLQYIGPRFCHHNPYFEGDAESLLRAMEEDVSNNPNKLIEIKQTIEEEDSVVVFSHVKQNQDDLGWAIVHIFRFQDEKIVELWDLAQSIPENSPNENGVF